MTLLAGFAVLLFGTWGCAALRESRTSLPMREYEKMIAGRLDADYVGTATCIAQCHTHDTLARDFRLSIHGEQVSAETKTPLVNCESCHGPGSLAIANIKDGKCDSSTFISLSSLPAAALSLVCLKCHSGQSLSSLSGWPGSRHAGAGVGCPDCHRLHKGPAQKVARTEVPDLCLGCHKALRARFSLPSHHPVLEGRMSCVDCHDPHGAAHEANLRLGPVRELCARCHADKTGPFLYEHADLGRDCQSCHDPHGAPNRRMTRYAQPFLCLQCHSGHNTARRPAIQSGSRDAKQAMFTSCTDCHTRIHGSNLPGFRNDDRFTR